MFESIRGRTLAGIMVLGAVASIGAMIGCNGNTGTGNDDPGQGVYVSDGGAGATLTITLPQAKDGKEIAVTETTGFLVDLKDAKGVGIPDTRIFCESEKGIAIIEPSSGGVAFESTNADGRMSGVIGGLLPGSFMMECRAPEGFNLVARVHVKITGEVPADFQGWPGAAGGNLGGGVIIDQTPSPENNGLRATSIQFVENGGLNSGVIDNHQEICTPASGSTSSVREKIYDPDWYLTLKNDNNQLIFVRSVQVTLGGVVMPTVERVAEVSPDGGSVSFQGTFLDQGAYIPNALGTSYECLFYYHGTSRCVQDGTYPAIFTITAETENGTTFSIEATTSVTFEEISNCSATSSSSTAG